MMTSVTPGDGQKTEIIVIGAGAAGLGAARALQDEGYQVMVLDP